ncbi:MAG: heavy metal-associated domain-containing protein [Sediminibacterium sp.]
METLTKQSYHIGGMSCGGCAASVKNKLSAAPGVISVSVDLANKEAEISSTEAIETATLQRALSTTHYTISELSTKIE